MTARVTGLGGRSAPTADGRVTTGVVFGPVVTRHQTTHNSLITKPVDTTGASDGCVIAPKHPLRRVRILHPGTGTSQTNRRPSATRQHTQGPRPITWRSLTRTEQFNDGGDPGSPHLHLAVRRISPAPQGVDHTRREAIHTPADRQRLGPPWRGALTHPLREMRSYEGPRLDGASPTTARTRRPRRTTPTARTMTETMTKKTRALALVRTAPGGRRA